MNLPKQIGHYILDHQIGDGGSSIVWQAHHAVLTEHKVAFKFLKSHNPDDIHRFEREASIVLRLNHPNIIKTYDYGQYEDLHYTLSEYIPGISLAQLIENQGPIPFATAMPIFRQIAAGLDYAHSEQVIHRDVSPKNILITAEGQRVVLIDFGIARGHHGASSETNSFLGTLGFLSPEHFPNGKPISHLSDIFALGIVFYYMLSYTFPWDEHPTPPFPPPIPLHQRRIPHLPRSVDRVLRTMLAPDPAHRYPSAQAVVDALDQIIAQHQMLTQLLAKLPPTTSDDHHTFQASGFKPSGIELTLGDAVARGPLERAYRHAETLRNPQELTRIFNEWANSHPWPLRRDLLGRLAQFHKVTSTNIYFYRLRLLYEERTPAQSQERPDLQTLKPPPVESEMDRWKIDLPKISGFQDEPGGQITIPGSIKVVKCPTCKGSGMTICPRCKGTRRVMVMRPVAAPLPTPGTPATAAATAQSYTDPQRPTSVGTSVGTVATPPPPPPRMEPVPEPCPDCDGTGGMQCSRCQGARNLVQEKIFRWSRKHASLYHHDDHMMLDFDWLVQTCAAEELYCERYTDGMNPRWSKIQAIKTLLEQAKQPVHTNNRIVMSELQISFIPVTEVVFDLGEPLTPDSLYICGFENIIPDDGRLYNWERIITISVTAFAVIVALIMALFVFWLW